MHRSAPQTARSAAQGVFAFSLSLFPHRFVVCSVLTSLLDLTPQGTPKSVLFVQLEPLVACLEQLPQLFVWVVQLGSIRPAALRPVSLVLPEPTHLLSIQRATPACPVGLASIRLLARLFVLNVQLERSQHQPRQPVVKLVLRGRFRKAAHVLLALPERTRRLERRIAPIAVQGSLHY